MTFDTADLSHYRDHVHLLVAKLSTIDHSAVLHCAHLPVMLHTLYWASLFARTVKLPS